MRIILGLRIGRSLLNRQTTAAGVAFTWGRLHLSACLVAAKEARLSQKGPQPPLFHWRLPLWLKSMNNTLIESGLRRRAPNLLYLFGPSILQQLLQQPSHSRCTSAVNECDMAQ